MENNKFVKYKCYILSFIFFGIFLIFSLVFAYSPYYTHPDLTEEIAKLWNLKNNNQNLEISQNEIQWLREGAINEDTPARWINHFYDPINKTGWQGKHFGTLSQEEGLYEGESMAPKPAIASINWVTNQEYQSAYGRQYGNQTWQKTIKSYIDGDKKSAFIALGHILHLVEDLSVPDHTRNDTHADLYGDPGSPYEKYSQEYTNFNKLNIADNLKSKELLNFSTIQDAFNYLANYSNNNFFSEDTINNDEFRLPNMEKLEKRIESINNKKYLFLYDEQKQINVAYLKEDDKYSTRNDYFVLPSYFNNLAPQAVLTGASVLNLFFQEVEKYKQNPELLPEIVPDSNEAILSYLQKSPRLALVNIKDVSDKMIIDSQISFAQINNFFTSIFNSDNQNQLTAQILSNFQTSQSDNFVLPSVIDNQNELQSGTELQPQINNQPQQSTLTDQQNQIIELQNQFNDIKTQAENINQQISLLSADSVNFVNSQANVNNQSISLSGPKIIYGGGGGGGGSVQQNNQIASAVENNSILAVSENSSSTELSILTDSIVTTTITIDITTTTSLASNLANHIVISEIQAGTDDNPNNEFVELYNPTENNIDISGFSLKRRVSQNSTSTKNLVLNFPATSTISAKSFFLISHEDYSKTTAPDLIYSNNSNPMAYKDDIVFLENNVGAVIDEVYYEEILKGKSLERKANTNSTSDSMAMGDDRFLGNGYDTDNTDDFVIRDIPESQNLQNLPEPRNKPMVPDNFSIEYNFSTLELIFNWKESQDFSGSTSTITYKIFETANTNSIIETNLKSAQLKIDEVGRDYEFSILAFDKDGLSSDLATAKIYVPSFLPDIYFYEDFRENSNDYLIEAYYDSYPFVTDLYQNNSNSTWKILVFYLNSEPTKEMMINSFSQSSFNPSDSLLYVRYPKCSGDSYYSIGSSAKILILPDIQDRCGIWGGTMNMAMNLNREDNHFIIRTASSPSNLALTSADYITIAYYSFESSSWWSGGGEYFRLVAVDKAKHYFQESAPSHQAPEAPSNFSIESYDVNSQKLFLRFEASKDTDTIDSIISYEISQSEQINFLSPEAIWSAIPYTAAEVVMALDSKLVIRAKDDFGNFSAIKILTLKINEAGNYYFDVSDEQSVASF